MTLADAQQYGINTLNGYYTPEEVKTMLRIVFTDLLQIDSNQFFNPSNMIIAEEKFTLLKLALERLKNYEPLQYITGLSYFLDFTVQVNPHVLIPRPETEELAALIIKEEKKLSPIKAIDIGTGSGILAIAMSKHLPLLTNIVGVDISKQALDTAQINAEKNKANITFKQHNFLLPEERQKLGNNYNLIVSNPPYIPVSEKNSLDQNVAAYEPAHALFVPDNDPLIFYKAIAEFGLEHGASHARIYVELHENLGRETAQIFENTQGYDNIKLIQDMSGNNRFIKAEKR